MINIYIDIIFGKTGGNNLCQQLVFSHHLSQIQLPHWNAGFSLGKPKEDRLGVEVFELIMEHDNLIRIETALRLNHPPVEALIPEYEGKYGKDKVMFSGYRKQMFGRLIGIYLIQELGNYKTGKLVPIRHPYNRHFKNASKFKNI